MSTRECFVSFLCLFWNLLWPEDASTRDSARRRACFVWFKLFVSELIEARRRIDAHNSAFVGLWPARRRVHIVMIFAKCISSMQLSYASPLAVRAFGHVDCSVSAFSLGSSFVLFAASAFIIVVCSQSARQRAQFA